MFTDFCVQFISGFVFCKRGEKEMAERETERWRDRERDRERGGFLTTGGCFIYGGKAVSWQPDGKMGTERSRY